jgi:flagellar hook-associated protein 2
MISSPGLGSGLDINGIISKLMEVEQRPLLQLSNKEATQQAQISAYGSLKGALSTLQGAAKTLAKSDFFAGLKATLTDSTIATVSASSRATAGAHQIETLTLAQPQKIKSEPFALASTSIGSGTLTIEFGTYNVDGTFTNNPQVTTKTITIEPNQSSLADIRTAINNAAVGITASIVNDGNGNRLIITSNNTGLNNTLKINVEDDDGNHTNATGLSQLAYDATTGGIRNMTETVTAQNATMKIDGILISKPSNTITDALEGVTFNLLKAAPGTTTSLSIAQDTSKIQTAISTLVNAYNELGKTIVDLSQYDAKNNKASILTGDSTVRAVQTQIRGVLSSILPTTIDGLSSLSQIGISFQKDGTLTFDSGKLNTVFNESPENIAALFATDGFAVKLDKTIDGMLKNNGLLDGRMDGINASIKDIGKQREAFVNRLETVEKRYRNQFTALDAMISSMSQTSNFLQQQLANIPKLGS